MIQKSPYKKIHSKSIYKNQWIELIEDKIIRPDNKKGTYSFIKTRGDSIFIVAIDQEDKIYLVNLFRYPSQKFSLEIPGGNSDKENLLKAAKRELMEETGLIAKKWKKLKSIIYPFNGICSEKSHFFIAQELTQTKTDQMIEEGINKVKKIPFTKVIKMIEKGEITDGQSILAILYAAFFLKKIN